MTGLTTGFAPPPDHCPAGHRTYAGSYLYGWRPCSCKAVLPSRGHRTYRCKTCLDQHAETVILDPPCQKQETVTATS